MKNRLLILALVVAFSLIVLELANITWSSEILISSKQPLEIQYASEVPYVISVVKEQKTLSNDYIILITKELEPSYGYQIPYFGSFKDVSAVNEFKFSWEKEGVYIKTAMNLQLFIPKEYFINGR